MFRRYVCCPFQDIIYLFGIARPAELVQGLLDFHRGYW